MGFGIEATDRWDGRSAEATEYGLDSCRQYPDFGRILKEHM